MTADAAPVGAQVRFAAVYLLDAPYAIDHLYHYYVPVSLCGQIRVGSLVAVPFGRTNRRSYALVSAVSSQCDVEKTKPVLAVLPDRFSLSEEMRGLCFFLKERTLCTVGDAVRCLLPGAIFSTLFEFYGPGLRRDLPPEPLAAQIVQYVQREGRVARETLLEQYACGVMLLGRLVEEDYLARAYERKTENGKTEKYISLAIPPAQLQDLLTPPPGQKRLRCNEAQEKLLRTVCEGGDIPRAELCERTHTTPGQVMTLVRRGLLAVTDEPVWRDPYAALPRGTDRSPICLSRAQRTAYETLEGLYLTHTARAALLHGVTGSGKTKVMMHLIDRVIAEGRQVIFMVPEIALTPQTVGLFCARYGERVAVVHSLLSEGERLDAWRRIAEGQIDLVIGTRSAVFAPCVNLGLIVMDEEHEHTYKSDSDPKYHTRDVAAYRCGQHSAMLLLASATPSLESYYKAEQGRYTLVPLRERYGGATLPQTEIVDLRQELRAGNRSPLSRPLYDALRQTLAAGGQAILFINRRGYHTSLTCKACGEPLVCPHCSLALTHHADRLGGSLVCHVCGYRTALPQVCPACGEKQLSYLGFGTQKIEDELKLYLPEARVLRMDADTTAGKGAHDRLLDAFRRGEADILLGTQMVTKGHDFSRVTLVGVLLADTSLYINDFRAAERTFALITQVIGRAGRAQSPGRAIIQTYVPENETVRLACAQDYVRFYQGEIALRRSLSFPPFCDLVQLTLSSMHEDELMIASVRLTEMMTETARRDFPDLPLQIFGPFEAQVYKAAGHYRLRMMVKCRMGNRTRAYFSHILQVFGQAAGHRITLSLDIDPGKG